MGNSIVILLLGVAFVATGCNFISMQNNNGQESNDTQTNQTAVGDSGAQIVFDKTHLYLDTIDTGSVSTCVFHYYNKGNQPLVVSNVITTCGCVKTYYQENPLMPGMADSITLQLRITETGNLTKAVVVKSNAINNPVATLRLFGYVIE